MGRILDKLQYKKYLGDDQLKKLADIGKGNKDLYKRQIQKLSHVNLPKEYSPELREFALTLHFYSTAAYNYARRKFNTCLPHPKTISKWYRTVNGELGLCSDALDSIKVRVEDAKYPLIGALMFDEMHIKQNIHKSGGSFKGFVDLGKSIEHEHDSENVPIVAKEVLIFMVNCINQAWKISIAYFLIDGLKAEQIANIVNECLKALHDSKIKIVSLTFDGTTINLSAAKSLITENDEELGAENKIKKS